MMGKHTIICRNIGREIVGVCDRYYDNKCCMCPAPAIPVAVDDIRMMINMLKSDGENSKKAVKQNLESYIKDYEKN